MQQMQETLLQLPCTYDMCLLEKWFSVVLCGQLISRPKTMSYVIGDMKAAGVHATALTVEGGESGLQPHQEARQLSGQG